MSLKLGDTKVYEPQLRARLAGVELRERVHREGHFAERGHASSSSSLLLSSLELSDTTIYKPSMRALLGTASHFCEVVVLKLRTEPLGLNLNPGPSTQGMKLFLLHSRYRSLSLKLSYTKVYDPQIRSRLAGHEVCERVHRKGHLAEP